MARPRAADRQPSARSAATRECTTCGLFVYWQTIDGLAWMVDMNVASRAQVVAHLLHDKRRYEIFKAVPLGNSSVSMVAENPVLLARHLATGGSLDDWPRLHLGHPHRRAGGRSGARRSAPQHGVGGTIAQEAEPPPF